MITGTVTTPEEMGKMCSMSCCLRGASPGRQSYYSRHTDMLRKTCSVHPPSRTVGIEISNLVAWHKGRFKSASGWLFMSRIGPLQLAVPSVTAVSSLCC